MMILAGVSVVMVISQADTYIWSVVMKAEELMMDLIAVEIDLDLVGDGDDCL